MGVKTQQERAEFLEARRNGIGGSDAAASMGLSPWKTALQLWGEKTGKVEEPDLEATREFVKWGNRLEDVIAEAYTEETGRKTRRRRRQLRSKPFPFMTANLDRDVFDPVLGKGVLQIKTTDVRHYKKWQDDSLTEVLHYDIQLQHEMQVAEAQWGAFAVLVGGNHLLHDKNTLHLFRLPNPDFVEYMVDQEADFWNCVKADQEPGLSNLGDDAAALLALHPPEKVIQAPVYFSAKQRAQWQAIHMLKEDRSSISEQIDKIEDQIKQSIGDHNHGIFTEGDGYTWNASFPRRVHGTTVMRSIYAALLKAHPRMPFKKIFPTEEEWIKAITAVSSVRTLLYKKAPGIITSEPGQRGPADRRLFGDDGPKATKKRKTKKKGKRAPKRVAKGKLKRAPKRK